MRILVIGPSWIGDMMMSQSLYRTLKVRYPQVVIDVIAPAWSRPLLLCMPEVNEAILMPLDHGALEVGTRRKLGRDLREKRYDRAYVLPNSFKSALVPFFAEVPHRIGWLGEIRYGLLNDIRVLNKTAWPLMVGRYVALAYDKSVIRNEKDLPQPLLWPHLRFSDSRKSHIYNAFDISFKRQIIGFFPGAEFGPAKRWPHYHYAELAKKLIDEGYQIVLFGSVKDRETGNKILARLSNDRQAECRNLTGKIQLEQSVILISACKAVVTNDSGLMHVAAALGLPLVALYGPSSPNFTPPLSHKASVIHLINNYRKVRKGNATEGYHQSLIDITPERVIEKLHKLLSSEGS